MTDKETIIFFIYMFLSAPFTVSLLIQTFFNLIDDRNAILEDTKEFYSNKKYLVMSIIFFPTTLGVYFIMSIFYLFGKSFDFLEK